MEKRVIDYYLMTAVLLLLGIGVLIVYSSSAILSLEKFNDSYHYLKKEVLFAVLGLGLMVVFMSIDYHLYWKFIYPILFFILLALFLIFIPGLGHSAGGAQRWVRLAGFTFQPSELTKIGVVLFLAYTLAKKKEKMEDFLIGFLPAIVISMLFAGIILLQKDLGTALTITLVVMVMLFVGGTRFRYLGYALLAAVPLLYFMIFSVEYRRKRILAFLDPWEHKSDAGFQIIQSYVAFNSGGFWGQGLGEGKQKLFYLPAAHTDFIFSVIGEELGLIGVLFVIGLFFFLMIRGFKIAFKAPDLFGTYIALGITSLIIIQALFNFGVTLGILPTKGLPLPFISHGGTSLLVMMVLVGILLNISSQANQRS